MSPKPRKPYIPRRTAFGRRLTKARTERGLTQTEAATDLGVTLATWVRWETGATRPRGRMALAAVARFLEAAKR